MIKLRYSPETGEIGEGYNDVIDVPEPFLVITEDEHDRIKQDEDNYYFVENGILVTKEKMPILRKKAFLQDSFSTSLGYIRFKPTLKNGSQIDFIALLPQYKALAKMGYLPAKAFIYYNEPDCTQEFTEEYLKSLQNESPQMNIQEYEKFELEVTNAYQKAFFG